MKTFANVVWAILIGWWAALVNYISAFLCFITIIFIPIGHQYVKFAKLSWMPFGKKVVLTKDGGKTVLNVVWAVLFGWEQALACFLGGCLLCVTIIGIPLGLQSFKFAKLYLLPLGATIEKE